MRILMLGNSFTSTNQLPERLAQLTDAEVTAHTRGGARLAEHLNPATRMGVRTQTALRDGHWDYVILQEMSNGPITAKAKFLDSVRRLSALIRESGAEPVLYATWAYENEEKLAALGLTRAEMHRQMQESFREAAAENQLLTANVGACFAAYAGPEPLYAADGVHPSPFGTGLAARVLADTLRQG